MINSDKGEYCKHTNFGKPRRTSSHDELTNYRKEQGVRVPFVVVPPLGDGSWAPSRGMQSYAPMELLDLTPTLADLAGIPSKYGSQYGRYTWEGVTLRPILENPSTGYVKEFAVSQFERKAQQILGYTVRTTRYRLTMWRNSPFNFNSKLGYEELYDFVGDQGETTNWASSANYSQIRSTILSLWKGQPPPSLEPPFDFDERDVVSALPLQPFP